MKRLITLLALVGAISQALAQAPYKFTCFDIEAGAGYSAPSSFFIFKNKLYFSARTAASGRELWVTDGTTAGTKMVADINSGGYSSLDSVDSPGFIEMGGKLYFSAFDNTHGFELWVTDGTASGTQIVKDICPGISVSTNVSKREVYNGKLYFSASDCSISGNELWVSDGTAAGTLMLKDINPSGFSNPMNFTVYNGKLYFAASTGITSTGHELWVTDGTAAGTQIVKDINPGGFASDPRALTVQNGKLYFCATEGVNGNELWVSDGTAAGTQMVKNIYPGSGNGYDAFTMLTYNGKVYFVGYDLTGYHLWVTDGTAAGTQIAVPNTEIFPGLNIFGVYKNKIYFQGRSSTTNYWELWSTDGTSAGTQLVKDIMGTGASYGGSKPEHMFPYKNHLYFIAIKGIPGGIKDYQLYRTDGTAAGTVPVAPTGSATVAPIPRQPFIMFDSTMYLGANWDSKFLELWAMKDTTGSGSGPGPGSVSNIAWDNALSIYPNPNNGNFTLQLNAANFGGTTVTINDIVGRTVFQSKVAEQTSQIDMGNVPKGIYLLKLQLGDAVVTERIMIE